MRTPAKRRVVPPEAPPPRPPTINFELLQERFADATRRTTEPTITIRMPFGKYIGEPVDRLPASYLCWLQSAAIRSAGLRAAIDEAHAQHCDREHEGEWR